jgi:release factor glutamine methyltransferase
MNFVSGQQLFAWRTTAQKMAIASSISPREIDLMLQEMAALDSLSLRLGTFLERSAIPLKIPFSDLENLWNCRLQERKPVQYLLGVTSWRNFSLKVTPDVLIPRPETEYLIDLVAEITANSPLSCGNWVDLGTGSGAIALGLADHLTNAQIYAIDASEAALKIAQKNGQNLGLSERIKFLLGDWWSPLTHLKGQISGMVSNPPYIPTNIIPELQIEVVKHEPHLALDGGQDGLDCVRYLVETAPEYLISGGVWLMEFMAGQGDQIAQLLTENGHYNQISIINDLAGFDRYALAYRR